MCIRDSRYGPMEWAQLAIDCSVVGLCCKERHGGIIESQLHIRRVKADDFRHYKIIAENSVATAAKDVTLYQSMICIL